MQKASGRSLGQEDPTPVFLHGEFHGQRSLASYSPSVCKELDMTVTITHSLKELNLSNAVSYLDLFDIYKILKANIVEYTLVIYACNIYQNRPPAGS